MVFTSSLATSSPDVSAEGRAWCCPFLRTSWQVLGYQQTQASEPEQQMWQQDAKPAAPSGPEHSQPEAAPGGSGFSTDKRHIKAAAPATASPWGLAQMGQPCLSVVFCSLCLLQPLPASAFVFLQGHPPNIVLRLLVLYCPPTQFLCPPLRPRLLSRRGGSGTKQVPGASGGSRAQAAFLGSGDSPRCPLAPRAAGAWGHAALPAPGQPSRRGRGEGHGLWPCMPAPEPLPGTRLGRSRRSFQPLLSARRRENQASVPQGCQGDIFGGRRAGRGCVLGAGSWGSPSVPAPGCPCPGPPSSVGPPAAGCRWEPGAGVGGQRDAGGATQR